MLKKLFLFAMLFSILLGCSALDSVKDNSTLGSGTYYLLTFDSNGGSGDMAPMTLKKGEVVSLPFNTFQKTDYEFIGWALNPYSNSTYLDGESITISSDTVLYAQWLYNGSTTNPDPSEVYTIIFNNNGGSGYMLPITVPKGQGIRLSPNTYTRDGFSFAGWSKSELGAVEYNDNATIYPADNMTLYAVWNTLPKYKITYNSNTSNNQIKEVYKYAPQYGNVIYLDKNEFTNGNKKFIGWSTNSSSVRGEYQDIAPLSSLTSDMTLYAVWDDNPIVIKFSSNGGKGTMPDLYAKKGDKIILPTATFTKDDGVLKGNFYQLDIDIYNYYNFNTEYTVTDNATFSVLWVPLPKPDEPISGGNSDTYKNVTVWVDGVTVKDEDWVDSVIEGLRYAVRKSYSGWYDTDQYFYNLCWAGASSNLLHWWYDRNKDNIEKYFSHYAPEGTFRPDMSYKGWGVSSIFQDFVDKWPNHGGYIETGLKWYLIGSNQNWGGAYFKDVFGDNSDFAEFHGALNQYKLNTALDKAFKNKMAIGASEINMSGGHAITIWGAHFDEEGLVDKIYVSDSATSSGSNVEGKPETGVMGIDIVYSFDDVFGKVYMKNYLGGLIPLTSVTLFSNCNDIWDEYFKNHSPIR